MASFDRIETFLLGPSREDSRHRSRDSSLPFSDIRTPSDTTALSPLVDLSAAIFIDIATVSPAADVEAVLSDITMRLENSSITMIAGPIGSGKSTLIKAILGEVSFTGNIFVSSKRIAYCAQTPWLLSDTLRRNVLGLADTTDIDELWYQTVMHACALDEDIALMAEGDQTVIGSRGFNLSLGQRQRLVSIFILYVNNHDYVFLITID